VRASSQAARQALHAEWTKLRTTPSAAWLVLAAVVTTIAVSAVAVAGANHTSAGADLDTTRLSLVGIYLGQAIVAILAVLVISSEYSYGMIRTTLVALPRRPAMLAAKAVIVGGAALAAGTVAVAGCLLLGRLALPAQGLTPAHGHALLSVANGPTLRAAVGSVVYLVLIALLSLGVATIVRDSATSVGVVLGLLYLFPILAQLVGNPHWRRRLQQIGPMTAGLAVQATVNLRALPIGPWAGLGVLAAWAATALLAGGLALWLRDA
jgi:ABC-2 type transport system permease protein